MALFLSSHPWFAAFQPLPSSALLLCPSPPTPTFSFPLLLVPWLPLRRHLCNTMFYVLWNPHRSRLKYNLDVADRLADEHVLIGVYVNLLQNNPHTWLVGVPLRLGRRQRTQCALLNCHLMTFSLTSRISERVTVLTLHAVRANMQTVYSDVTVISSSPC